MQLIVTKQVQTRAPNQIPSFRLMFPLFFLLSSPSSLHLPFFLSFLFFLASLPLDPLSVGSVQSPPPHPPVSSFQSFCVSGQCHKPSRGPESYGFALGREQRLLVSAPFVVCCSLSVSLSPSVTPSLSLLLSLIRIKPEPAQWLFTEIGWPRRPRADVEKGR